MRYDRVPALFLVYFYHFPPGCFDRRKASASNARAHRNHVVLSEIKR